MNHGDFDVADSLGPALVHGRNLFSALFRKPEAKFVDTNHRRVMLIDDFNCVADVISVTVRAEQDVCLLHFLVGRGTHGIAHDPGIDEDGLARRGLDAESRVAQPRQFDASQVHAVCSSWLLASSF